MHADGSRRAPADQTDSLPLLFHADSWRSAALYHASGFVAPDPFTFLELGGQRVLLTRTLEAGRARKESRATAVRDLREFGHEELVADGLPPDVVDAIVVARLLEECGVREAAVPRDFPLYLAEGLRARGITLRIARDLDERRRRKGAHELAGIEAAQRAAEEAFAAAVDALRRADVAGDGTLRLDGQPLTAERMRVLYEVALLQRGCDAPEGTIVAPGLQAADPHADGTGPCRADEAIVMDVFPRHRATRYYADMARTVCRGTPPVEIARMYEAVRRAQEEAIAMIRPGIAGRAVHERVEDVLYAAGYATLREGQRREGVPAFIHGTGHGVGLDIHERPNLGRAGAAPLEAGDVVTVEPGLYDPASGGVRLEDMVVVTADGCRNLTRAPKELTIG